MSLIRIVVALALALVMVSIFSGCACQHEWVEANCNEPAKCSLCSETQGQAKGHTWNSATCETPKICSVCGAADGNAVGHTWTEATCLTAKTCSICNKTNGKELGHDWQDATYELPKTCRRCGITEGEPRNIFKENNLNEHAEAAYYNDYFVDYFTPDEYVKLYNTAQKFSATPEKAIGESLFFAYQRIATFNSVEHKYVIMDTLGNVVRDYSKYNQGVTRFAKIGKYSFIPICNAPSIFEIVDESGTVLSEFNAGLENRYIQHICDMGEGYNLFITSWGGYGIYLLSPSGEICKVHWDYKGNWDGRPTKANDFIQHIESGRLTIGRLSEGMFSVLYDFLGTYAYYFNIDGTLAIDLSKDITNYSVYKMEQFKDGRAKIYFVGADFMRYSTIIDDSGQFVEEPVKIQQ